MAVAPKLLDESPLEVIIIGAGISGLTAGHRILQQMKIAQRAVNLTVVESDTECGGVIRSTRNEYGILEEGPEAFVTHKPGALELAKELGLSDSLVASSSKASTTFIARGSSLERLPEGFIMFAPTRLTPLAMSPLFSWQGKLRMALDLVLPARNDSADESLSDFVTRRLGKEALEKLAEPLISGIYSTEPDRLSANCAVPRLKEMERIHGSIIRGLIQAKRNNSSKGPIAAFVSLHNGMQSLTDALASEIGKDRILLNSCVKVVRHGLAKRWRVILSSGRQLEADAVIVATPAHVTSKLLRDVSPEISHELAGIEYGASTMVSLIFPRTSIRNNLDGSGFVVPASEGRFISACSFSSVKFEMRTRHDCVLLRAFAKTNPSTDESDIVEKVLIDLRALLQIEGAPLYYRVTRPATGLPRYTVGHQGRIQTVMKEAARYPGLKLIGNSYQGIGIPDCIDSARTAADELVASLSGRVTAI